MISRNIPNNDLPAVVHRVTVVNSEILFIELVDHVKFIRKSRGQMFIIIISLRLDSTPVRVSEISAVNELFVP